MRRIALLLVTMLALGAFALPAIASEESTEGEKKVDPALEEQLRYGAPGENKAVSDDDRKAALSAVASESSAVPAIITFGMFGVVLVTIGAGVVVYRRA